MSWLWQRENNEDVSRLGTEFPRTAGGDDHELATRRLVGGRCGVTPGRQLSLPQQFATRRIKGVKSLVLRAADEDKASGGDDGAPEVLRARLWNSACG